MYKQFFGKNHQITFSKENDYYELLGYLAKSDNSSSLTWEKNEEQGAWGSEGRILFYTKKPQLSANLKHTAGVGNIITRVNCNEFVENIKDKHHFVMGKNQNISLIKNTIPQKYQVDFERGLIIKVI